MDIYRFPIVYANEQQNYPCWYNMVVKVQLTTGTTILLQPVCLKNV